MAERQTGPQRAGDFSHSHIAHSPEVLMSDPSHRRMVEEVLADAADTAIYSGISSLAPGVVAAMAKVRRHCFVPSELSSSAYLNRPLPIGHGQTISQPFIVALMTDLLKIRAGERVLEIGTGSGYQAAVLAELGAEVYSIEIIASLWKKAGEQLKSAGYTNVHTRLGDGYDGWPQAAPFDAVIVTAAASHVPKPLIQQIRPGGRMVIPLGEKYAEQSLIYIEKHEDSSIFSRDILPVIFVPLTRSS